MEKDINELKRLFYSDGLTQYGKRKLINHYEQQIQELKEIEQIHRQENGELRERVKELEENINKQKQLTKIAQTITDESIKEALIEFEKDYIPISLVKEKIEEINKAYEDSKDENGESQYYYPDYTIRVLEELLEKRK